MTNIQSVMKRSLAYGFTGAVLLPLIHESYANIGKTFSVLLLLILVVIAALRISAFELKQAFLGVTVMIAMTSILGLCLYIPIHELVYDFLTENSKYFELTYTEHFNYYISAALILISAYLICLLKFGFHKLVNKLKGNQLAAKNYIENAFDDEPESEED